MPRKEEEIRKRKLKARVRATKSCFIREGVGKGRKRHRPIPLKLLRKSKLDEDIQASQMGNAQTMSEKNSKNYGYVTCYEACRLRRIRQDF